MVDHNKVKDKETHTIITYDTLNCSPRFHGTVSFKTIKSNLRLKMWVETVTGISKNKRYQSGVRHMNY